MHLSYCFVVFGYANIVEDRVGASAKEVKICIGLL